MFYDIIPHSLHTLSIFKEDFQHFFTMKDKLVFDSENVVFTIKLLNFFSINKNLVFTIKLLDKPFPNNLLLLDLRGIIHLVFMFSPLIINCFTKCWLISISIWRERHKELEGDEKEQEIYLIEKERERKIRMRYI